MPETILNYTFKNPSLLTQALTHSSTGDKNYERLEFLGDRVLGLVIAAALYQKFPHEPEGDLAKRLAALVQGTMLAQIAREINLGEHIRFSDAELAAGGAQNDNILADVFEAAVGAMYLDGGMASCESFLLSVFETRFDTATAPPRHPKTVVQEWAQGQGLPVPAYAIIDKSGPDHAPLFTVQITVDGYPPESAQDTSRQNAEKAAAIAFVAAHNLT